MYLTCLREVLRMQFNVMPEHGITLGQILVALVIQVVANSAADDCKQNMFLNTCIEIIISYYLKHRKTMLRHSRASQLTRENRLTEAPVGE